MDYKFLRSETVMRYGVVCDSMHKIYDANLKGGALLHRFNNRVGVAYSAIYDGDYEALNCETSRELGMIKLWNKMYKKDK